jgi:hypothetical protein
MSPNLFPYSCTRDGETGTEIIPAYGSVLVCSVIGLSFRCEVFPVYRCLCRMYVLCHVYVGRILNSIFFYALNMFLVSYIKRSSRLSDIFEWAFVAFQFVYFTLVIYVGYLFLWFYIVFYCVGSFK